jgi:hypothetical protein
MEFILIKTLPAIFLVICLLELVKLQYISGKFSDPHCEFTLLPFLFWNDTLKNEEAIRFKLPPISKKP